VVLRKAGLPMDIEKKETDVFRVFLYLLRKEQEEFTVSVEEQQRTYYRILEALEGT
jgi:hypothetical protein